MKQKILIFKIFVLIFLGSFCGCRKEEDILSKGGMYIETYPQKGNIKINFINKEKLIIIWDEKRSEEF